MKITLDLSPDDIKFLSQILSRENCEKLTNFPNNKVDDVRDIIKDAIIKASGADLEVTVSYQFNNQKHLRDMQEMLVNKILEELDWNESDITTSR